MANSKGRSNNSPIPKSDKSDSGSSEDFDFYGFTKPFVYYYAVSVLMSVSLVVSSYGIDLYITTPCRLRTGLWLVEW